MYEFLNQRVFFNPADSNVILEDGENKPQYIAMVIEINEAGLAKLAIWKTDGSQDHMDNVPLRKAEDDGSFATWEPVDSHD